MIRVILTTIAGDKIQSDSESGGIYDTIYIIFGTNAFINKADLDNYSILTTLFISRILNSNNNINIIWILLPKLNTRTSIKNSLDAIGIRYIDINLICGSNYNDSINNKKINIGNNFNKAKNIFN